MPNYKKTNLSNWGNFPSIETKLYASQFVQEAQAIIAQSKTIIARGNGRSYGDASLGKTIFSTQKWNKILAFDEKTGVLECQSGTLLADILDLVVPKGWFLSVTPGTKLISVGGAIATDVHGKNHHSKGSFADFVYSFELLNENGDLQTITKEENKPLFWQTAGGMGATGIIYSAKIQLTAIETSYIAQKKVVCQNLEETLSMFEKYAELTFSVAWIDCLAKGKQMGRSIITFGEHAKSNQLPKKWQSNPLKNYNAQSKISIPFNFPDFILKKWSIKLFNILYFNKERKKIVDEIVHFDSFFYPLDKLHHWNRIYGKKGFVQYQFVLPLEKGNKTLIQVFRKIVNSGEGSFLSVLKLMGEANASTMGFPMKGYTLALDFKLSPKVEKLLSELDEIIAQAGGRFYLAKDARMQSKTFAQTQKNIVRSTKFVSTQHLRLENC